ncbi:hypothetical protein [Enterococcus sp. BWR-S5]|uniref:hypothetical protein n=1 Tax=Enterococcus sp. BWR-S5 TaxID=2787714 RepID=UPI001922391F|nr:hypothetical protein [Enterococcus sp. BWR-S5]MBL1224140.1 hypothetical protein [Enterococcus sp. BWR-S5]
MYRIRVERLFLVVYISISLVVLAGCSDKALLTENDFKEKIRAGMSMSEVKQVLGEPEKIEEDNDLAAEQRYKDNESSIDMWDWNYYEGFYGDESRMTDFFDKLRKEQDLIYYEYIFSNENKEDNWRIYFIDNEVVWMSFP